MNKLSDKLIELQQKEINKTNIVSIAVELIELNHKIMDDLTKARDIRSLMLPVYREFWLQDDRSLYSYSFLKIDNEKMLSVFYDIGILLQVDRLENLCLVTSLGWDYKSITREQLDFISETIDSFNHNFIDIVRDYFRLKRYSNNTGICFNDTYSFYELKYNPQNHKLIGHQYTRSDYEFTYKEPFSVRTKEFDSRSKEPKIQKWYHDNFPEKYL